MNNGSFNLAEKLPYVSLNDLRADDGIWQNISTFDQNLAAARLLAVNKFKWESKEVKPVKRLSAFIENLLFDKGQCALFNDNGIWKVKLCVPSGGIDEFGDPESFTLTDFNGSGTVVVDNDDERFIWIKNNELCIPTIYWILKYCNRVAKIERTMDLNIDAQKTPYIIEASPEIMLSIQNIFKEIREMNEVVFIDQKSGIKENVNVLDLNAPYLVDKLYTQKTNEYNDLLNFLGINTVKEKKERLLYDEARISDELTDSYLDVWTAPRVRALREAKEKGIDLKLSILKLDKDDDTIQPGRGNNNQFNKDYQLDQGEGQNIKLRGES